MRGPYRKLDRVNRFGPARRFTHSPAFARSLELLLVLAGLCAFIADPAVGQPAPNVVQWGAPFPTAWLGRPLPSVPDDATNVVVASVSHFGGSVAALRRDGSVVAWGTNSDSYYFPHGLTNATAVAAGGAFGAAVTNGVPVVWGTDWDMYAMPVFLTNLVAIAIGGGYNADEPFFLRSDRTAGRWVAPFAFYPQFTNMVAIAEEASVGLGLRPDGTVLTWGIDNDMALTNAVAVAAGGVFVAALRADGTVVAWGGNGSGQTNVPADLTNAVAIAAGQDYCLALRANGTVVSWGGNELGQRSVPPGLSNVVSIAAGGYNSLAIIGTGMAPSRVMITNAAFTAGTFSVRVATDRGKVYALEYKDSLADAQWQILPLVAGNGASSSWMTSRPGPPSGFTGLADGDGLR